MAMAASIGQKIQVGTFMCLLLTQDAMGRPPIMSADACRASDDTILSIYLQEAMAQVKNSMPALRANISVLAAR